MRFRLIFIILLMLSGCSVSDQTTEEHFEGDGHAHDGSSPTEALIFVGESDIDNRYHVVTTYTKSGDDIYDVDFRIYDGDVELVYASQNGELQNDLNPSLYDQIQRLDQYVIGYNKFPKLDSNGHSDELITISIDMRPLADSFDKAK